MGKTREYILIGTLDYDRKRKRAVSVLITLLMGAGTAGSTATDLSAFIMGIETWRN